MPHPSIRMFFVKNQRLALTARPSRWHLEFLRTPTAWRRAFPHRRTRCPGSKGSKYAERLRNYVFKPAYHIEYNNTLLSASSAASTTCDTEPYSNALELLEEAARLIYYGMVCPAAFSRRASTKLRQLAHRSSAPKRCLDQPKTQLSKLERNDPFVPMTAASQTGMVIEGIEQHAIASDQMSRMATPCWPASPLAWKTARSGLFNSDDENLRRQRLH